MRWRRECCMRRSRRTPSSSAGIAAIQQELGVQPEFPAAVQAAAEQDARGPRMPDLDLTDLEFLTIDPAGAMDLDQAMHLAVEGDGYVVHYAIADVMAYVAPGDPVDVEAHARGESLYGADSKIPLHPPVLSEGAASLLPGEDRPAFVWTISLDGGRERDPREGRAREGALAQQARLRGRAAAARPGSGGLDPGPAGDDRQAADRAGGQAWRRLLADAGAGDRRGRRPVPARVPRDAARRVVERAALVAHRVRRGVR